MYGFQTYVCFNWNIWFYFQFKDNLCYSNFAFVLLLNVLYLTTYSTFGGNPLASAVAVASLKVVRDEGLVERYIPGLKEILLFCQMIFYFNILLVIFSFELVAELQGCKVRTRVQGPATEDPAEIPSNHKRSARKGFAECSGLKQWCTVSFCIWHLHQVEGERHSSKTHTWHHNSISPTPFNQVYTLHQRTVILCSSICSYVFMCN